MPSRVFIDRGQVPGEDHPRLRPHVVSRRRENTRAADVVALINNGTSIVPPTAPRKRWNIY